MKIQKKSPKLKIILASIGVLICLVAALIALEATGTTQLTGLFNKKLTDQSIKNNADTKNKQDFINNTSDSTTGGTKKTVTSSDITILTSRGTNGDIVISTQLKNVSDGTCDLTITSGSKTYTQTATVLYQASFSTCTGFSVPTSSLPTGTWQILLTVTSKGKSITQTSSTEVQ